MIKNISKKIKKVSDALRNLLQGRSLPDHESSVRLYLFYILTIISLCVSLIASLVLLFDGITRHTNLLETTSLITFSLFFFYCLLLILAKKGYKETSAHLLSLTFSVTSIYCTLKWGPSLPITILMAWVAVTTAGILLKGKSTIFISLILVCTLIYGVSRENSLGALSWRLSPATYPDIVIWSFIILSIAGVSWLTTQHTFTMLRRAKKYEAELEEEKKSLEIKVEERTAELRKVQAEQILNLASKAEIGSIAEGLFHDLMSPLSSVALIIEQMSKKNMQNKINTDSDDATMFIGTAMKAADRMRNFLITLRKYFNDLPLTTYFDPKQEINDAILLLSFKARNANVEIKLDTDEANQNYTKQSIQEQKVTVKNKDQATIFGNPVHFHRVFLNLISNSIDSCIQKTIQNNESAVNKVLISIKKEKIAPGNGFGFNKTNVLKIKVMDTGLGIPSERISQIFSDKWSSKNTETIKGHGLGLSIVKNLIEEGFNGKIAVESNYINKQKTTKNTEPKLKQNENTADLKTQFTTVFTIIIPCSYNQNLINT